MDKLTTLANTIKDNDETQQILAEKIGVNRNQIRRWINGESEMGIYKLKAICEYYNVSADYILGLDNDLNWPRGGKESRPDSTKYTFLYKINHFGDHNRNAPQKYGYSPLLRGFLVPRRGTYRNSL